MCSTKRIGGAAQSQATHTGRSNGSSLPGCGAGPGAFDFKQGDTKGTALWRLVRRFVKTPSRQQEACHAPKPILLDTGEITMPYAWYAHAAALCPQLGLASL